MPIPECIRSLDINSLNYCSFSALNFGDDDDGKARDVMVAVPHTVDSGYIDVYDIKSEKRIATAIGKADMETSSIKASRAGERKSANNSQNVEAHCLFLMPSDCHVDADTQDKRVEQL